uniref:Uncharacterized protein n=1 Tax=Leersia perrieri TaxID=77586 RepID=A0A0D9VS81_9ORYZ
MEVTMEDVPGDFEISGCGSTTTTTTTSSTSSLDDGTGTMYASWGELSPVADWGNFCSDDGVQEDLHGLIESMLCDDTLVGDAGLDDHPVMFRDDVYCYSNGSNPGSTTTTNPGTPAFDVEPPQNDDDCPEKGLRLLHLLMAASGALSGPHKSRELARVILVRLKEMVSHSHTGAANAAASNMERLAVHFTDALQALLDGSHPVTGRQASAAAAATTAAASQHHHAGDVLTAFQMLQDMSPYMKFGHFTANQAILEAVAGDRRVHIVDYDIAEGIQWASLMQAMTSRADGVPAPHLRITAVSRSGGGARAVQEAGRRLSSFAASIGQPFSFGQCRLDSDERFRPATVRMVKGETLVANCVLHQATATTAIRRPTGSVASFLSGMAALGAKLVTVVEEEGESDKDADESSGDFVRRFMEELHRYSAVWDSLEAGFPTQSRVRGLVERVILGPNIAGAVSRAYRGIDGGEGRCGWGEWMRGSGFAAVPLSCFNHSQARLLLGLFNDGYTVEETGPNKIVLGWKARRLMSASVWAPPPLPAPASPPEGVCQPVVGMAPAATGGFVRTEFDYIDSFLVEPAYALV